MTMTAEERAENRKIGMSIIRGINYAMDVAQGKVERDKKSLDERIAEWKKLAEDVENGRE